MPREKNMDVRKIVSMPGDLVEKIREYRFANQINTEAEAIRHLIERGLAAGAESAKTKSQPIDS